ncbi:uncharacterized protein Eint_111690 [Encephalitozoon intestinalis ATCC 50506]|uniref:Man1/Src1-like C-terminal domain-containing protein n=1 Tax=Encephalitozoon intestinalis (strain ATCC 50506) TaxID=876142 RepID=E0SA46_ENCIT|nr:uncharacterized protein Eint_111690 [Encephalitozoon intestinalis ATCC 50506]ADM12668.1 hypothetical protein Eint_111690 [Encephalitozoon intestinalis ATCC 50506]UTX46529.1 Man1-Src1p-C-terminal domain-containing protein [Encephalitozoon intestinalis]
MSKDTVLEDYLNKDFDYTKLTKTQLRKIMYENGIEPIPPATSKKSELLRAYKENIHDRIDVLISRKKNISLENSFQNASPRKKYGFTEVPDVPETNNKDGIPNRKSRGTSSSPGTPKKGERASKETPSRNFSLRDFSFSGDAPIQEKKDTLKETEEQDPSNQTPGSTMFNNSTVDFSGSSLSSSFILSSSEERSSLSRRSEKETGNIKMKKRAFTSDPTLDKPDFQSKHSSPRSMSSNSTRINISRPRPQRRKGKWCFATLLMIMVSVGIYFRFVCPYCSGDKLPCIPPPRHSRIVDGRLVCDKGFMVRHGIFKDYCIKDDRREKKMEKKVKELRKILERRSGDFMYRMAPTKSIPIELLTKDSEVIERLKKEVGIIISNEMIYSVNSRVSVKTFFRYYFKRILMISIPLSIVVVVIRVIRMFRRKKQERLQTARKIVKDIADVLVRQIYVSTKNTSFPSYVYIEQLRDCFGVDKKIWKEVEDIIFKNSNIRESCVEGRKAWEWVGPILYKPEFNGSLF